MFDIEGVSEKVYEAAVSSVIQSDRRNKFKTYLNAGIRFIGMILIVAVVYCLYLQVRKLRDMNLGECAVEFKQCLIGSFGDVGIPDIPDLPDISDYWWDILPDFN